MAPLYFFLALLAGAALLIIIGKAKDTEEKAFAENGIRTQGVVVENKVCWGEMSVIRPVVRFTTQAGEVVQAMDENGLAMAVPRFPAGQAIRLIYNQDNPADFRIISRGRFG